MQHVSSQRAFGPVILTGTLSALAVAPQGARDRTHAAVRITCRS